MSNFSIENIGALELNRARPQGFIRNGIDDATLEESAGTLYAGPTSPNIQCMASVQPFCPRRIDDSELETAAGKLHANATGAGNLCNFTGALSPVPTCRNRIDDGALEATAVMMASPSVDSVCWNTMGPRCLRIDDGAN